MSVSWKNYKIAALQSWKKLRLMKTFYDKNGCIVYNYDEVIF